MVITNLITLKVSQHDQCRASFTATKCDTATATARLLGVNECILRISRRVILGVSCISQESHVAMCLQGNPQMVIDV